MGYRFVVRNVLLSGRRGVLNLTVENTGFACMCDEADIRLVIETGEEKQNIPVFYDIRTLKPEETAEIQIEFLEVSGKEKRQEKIQGKELLKKGSRLYLEIIRCRDKKSIRFANRSAGKQMLLGELE